MLTAKILSNELPESLEQAGRTNRGAFFIERLTYMGLGLLMLVFFLGLGAGMKSCESSRRTNVHSNDLVGQVINAPMDTMDFLGVLALVGGVMGGFAIIMYQFGRCVVGPPKSKRSPEATIRKYYGNSLISAGGFKGVGLDGYVCLLDVAKKDVGTLSDFKNYWTSVNKEILKEITDHFAPKPFNQTSFSIESIDLSNETDHIVNGKVLVKIGVKCQTQGTFAPTWHSLGEVYYLIKCQVGQVGDRWYIGSNDWSAEFLGDSPRV